MKQWQWMGAWLSAAMLAAPAQALVQANASVGEPVVTVVDLEKSDGIEAAWKLGGSLKPYIHHAIKPAPVWDEVFGDGLLDPTGETAIGGRAAAPESGFFAIRDLYLYGTTATVTPYTRIQVSVPYRLDSLLQQLPGGGPIINAHASVELTLVAINDLRYDPVSEEWSYEPLGVVTKTMQLDSPPGALLLGPHSFEGQLEAGIDNNSATEAVFGLRAELVVFGNTAPVPEPQTLLLWLAGAAALAWRLRQPAA